MADVCGLYGYRRIDTPGIEDTDLIVRTSGEGSDIVQKETYTFDRSRRALADVAHRGHRADLPCVHPARPAPRAPAAEAVHDRADVAVRPSAAARATASTGSPGRSDRQRRPALDAEVIRLYVEILRRLEVSDYVLELNSIGDANCRPAYVERLTQWLDEHDAELDDEARAKRARRRCVSSTSRASECSACSRTRRRSATPSAMRAASTSSRCAPLDAYGVRYELVSTLVRGLDYYTRTTFEFKDEAIGAQDSICGGGRYDGLIEAIGGPPTPGIGFGAGVERLLLSVGSVSREREVDRRLLHRRRRRRPGRACSPSIAAAPLARPRVRTPITRDAPRRASSRRPSRLRARTTVDRRRRRCPHRPPGRRRADDAREPRRLPSPHELARSSLRRAASRARGARPSRSPAGSRVVVTTAVSSSSTSATRRRDAARRESRALACGRRRSRTTSGTSSCSRPRVKIVRRSPETVNAKMPTGEVEVQVDALRVLEPCPPLPFQLDEENVDEALRQSTAGSTYVASTCSATCACARSSCGSSARRWSARASSTSRRRSSGSRRRRARATFSCRRGCRRESSTRCRSRRRSRSSCS